MGKKRKAAEKQRIKDLASINFATEWDLAQEPVECEFDRFDFEQAIMNMWNTTDDLRQVTCLEQVAALAEVHHMRSQYTFEMFEKLVKAGKIV